MELLADVEPGKPSGNIFRAESTEQLTKIKVVWWPFALGVVLSLVASSLVVATAPSRFAATAKISWNNAKSFRALDELRDVMASDLVAQEVIKKMGAEESAPISISRDELIKHSELGITPDLKAVTVSHHGADTESARRLSDALASELLIALNEADPEGWGLVAPAVASSVPIQSFPWIEVIVVNLVILAGTVIVYLRVLRS